MLLLDVSAISVHVEIKLNGFPLLREIAHQPISFGSKIAPLAVNGTNLLEAIVARLPDGSAATEGGAAREASLKVKIYDIQAGIESPIDQVLIDLQLDQPALPLVGSPPTVLRREFNLVGQTAKAWEAAPPITGVSTGVREGILREVGLLHAALVRRDQQSVIALQSLSIRQSAISLGDTAEGALSRYEAFLGERMESGWRVEPLQEARLVLEPAAQNRVIHVSRDDGSPAIHTGSADARFLIDPWYSFVEGRWRIVK